jgi:hypothetical protein
MDDTLVVLIWKDEAGDIDVFIVEDRAAMIKAMMCHNIFLNSPNETQDVVDLRDMKETHPELFEEQGRHEPCFAEGRDVYIVVSGYSAPF